MLNNWKFAWISLCYYKSLAVKCRTAHTHMHTQLTRSNQFICINAIDNEWNMVLIEATIWTFRRKLARLIISTIRSICSVSLTLFLASKSFCRFGFFLFPTQNNFSWEKCLLSHLFTNNTYFTFAAAETLLIVITSPC